MNGSADRAAFSSAMKASTPAVEGRIGRVRGDREVRRGRAAGEPGVARRRRRRCRWPSRPRAADRPSSRRRGAGGVELRDEGVAAVGRRVERARCGREVCRACLARHVGVAAAVDRDAAAVVEAVAAEVGRVDERRAGRVQLRQGGVEGAVRASCRTRPAWSGSRSSWRTPARRRCRRVDRDARPLSTACRRGTSSRPAPSRSAFSFVTNMSICPAVVRLKRPRWSGSRSSSSRR